MPAPAMTSPRPEVPPAGPSQQDELRNTILQRRQQETLNSRRMGIGMGMSPEALQRADTLRDLRYQKDDLAGSMAPAPKVQSTEQVMTARTGLREQGMGQVAVLRKRAFEADKTGDADTAQKLYDEARRMEVGFRTSLPDHTEASALKIVENQDAGAKRAEAQRGAYGEIAAAQGNDPESLRQSILDRKKQESEMQRLAGARERSVIGGDIRENEMRGRIPPQERLAEAEGSLRIKQLQDATAGGGGANPVAAQVRTQNRQAALGMVGLDTPEAQSSFMQRSMELGKGISDAFRTMGVSGGNVADLDQLFAQFEATVMAPLEELSQLDQGVAREYASGVLNQLGSVPRMPSWVSGMPPAQKSRFDVVRRRLMNIMGEPEGGKSAS
jgi:hypothetical protein